jgi:hypothetical protein
MSRVEEEAHQRAAAEAERVQKKADRDARDAKVNDTSREAFAKLVKGQVQVEAKKKPEAEQAGKETQRGEERAGQAAKKTADEADRTARMSRGGVLHESRAMEQARSFQGALARTQNETQQHNTQLVERRETGTQKDRVEREDRQGELVDRAQVKREREAEQARVEAYEGKRVNAAIDTNQKNTDSSGGQQQGSDERAIAALRQKHAAPAAETAAAREVKQIPPELIEKLVSTVHLAVTQRGLKEFQIELKEGVLSGATLKISAQDGKVTLRFSGLDAEKKNLIESSRGDLMRRLGKKGLDLARLELA